MENANPAVFIRGAPDELLVLKRVEAVDSGLVGSDLTGFLDFSDKGGDAVFAQITLNKIEHRLLFLSERQNRQARLRRNK